jgi:hypothetical protein
MHATSTPPASGIAFGDPLPGYSVNSGFGMRVLSFERVRGAKVHEGVDIAAPMGEPIHATAEGVVVNTGLSPSYGNFVEVEHAGGVSSFYGHMSRTAGFAVGDKVASGEVIGFVGSTGHSTGPHLHFEIRKDGDHFDPQNFMGHAFLTLASMPLVRSAESVFGNFKGRVYHLAFYGRRFRHRSNYAMHTWHGGKRAHHVYYARNTHSIHGGRFGEGVIAR